MPFVIRPASPADAPALHALNAAFNSDTGATCDSIRRSLATGGEVVLIAECGGEAVGFCCAQVHHSFCYPAPVAEVTEMYVDEAHRRQGAASGMLHFLEDHLQTAYGVDEIHLLTGTHNHASQSAYKMAGFTPKNEVYMTKEVPRNR